MNRHALKRKLEQDRNQIEQNLDLKKEMAKSFKNELLEKSVTTAWEQILGTPKTQKEQDNTQTITEGEVVNIYSKEKGAEIQPAIDYTREILTTTEVSQKKEHNEIKSRIEEIIIELKEISKSSKLLQTTIKDVNMDIIPQAPGKYHVNFFEWILLTLHTARIRVEESANWASAVIGKRAKKDFWTLARKHGTSFQLSSERAVAQQVG
jgi:hypothetical protein